MPKNVRPSIDSAGLVIKTKKNDSIARNIALLIDAPCVGVDFLEVEKSIQVFELLREFRKIVL